MAKLRHGSGDFEGPWGRVTGSDDDRPDGSPDAMDLFTFLDRLVSDPVRTLGALALLCPAGVVVVTALEPSTEVLGAPVFPAGVVTAAVLVAVQAGARTVRSRRRARNQRTTRGWHGRKT